MVVVVVHSDGATGQNNINLISNYSGCTLILGLPYVISYVLEAQFYCRSAEVMLWCEKTSQAAASPLTFLEKTSPQTLIISHFLCSSAHGGEHVPTHIWTHIWTRTSSSLSCFRSHHTDLCFDFLDFFFSFNFPLVSTWFVESECKSFETAHASISGTWLTDQCVTPNKIIWVSSLLLSFCLNQSLFPECFSSITLFSSL